MLQRLHPKLAEIDLLTKSELDQVFSSHMDAEWRDRFRGVKFMKLPRINVVATGTQTTIAHVPPGQQQGPDSGFIWRIGRVTVSSNGADTGAVTLYNGTDFTNLSGEYQVDNTLKIGAAYYPGSRGLYVFPDEYLYYSAVTVAGNTYTVTGQAVEVPMEMQGKIL
jgi:hypothetical protein